MASIVMVVGVARYLGARLARALSHHPAVDRVVGVDVVTPEFDLGAAEFLEADIRTSAITRAIARSGADTVVHMNVLATQADAGGRVPQKEINVIGTMQLLGACQRSETVRKVVVKSSTAVYGAFPNAPALLAEDKVPTNISRRGYEKDASEVEAYVRGFSRRRPDIDVTILRFANVVGPRIRTPLSEYFLLPIVPVAIGRDPRFQLIHEDDAIEALQMAAVEDHPGIFNVAGDGFLVLSKALRRAGRPALWLPTLGTPLIGGVLRRAGITDMDDAQVRFLTHGRGVDTRRMREELGFEPTYSTVAAFDSMVAERGGQGVMDRERVLAVEDAVHAALREADG